MEMMFYDLKSQKWIDLYFNKHKNNKMLFDSKDCYYNTEYSKRK